MGSCLAIYSSLANWNALLGPQYQATQHMDNCKHGLYVDAGYPRAHYYGGITAPHILRVLLQIFYISDVDVRRDDIDPVTLLLEQDLKRLIS